MKDLIKVPDLRNISEEEKTAMINELGTISGKCFMQLFYALGLKTHIDFTCQNAENGEYFILSFRKIIKDEKAD